MLSHHMDARIPMRQLYILNELKRTPALSLSNIIELSGKARTTIQTTVDTMKRKGLIRVERAFHNNYYLITKAGLNCLNNFVNTFVTPFVNDNENIYQRDIK